MGEPSAVLITGASRGLGAAFSRAFVREGRPVALLARSAGALDELSRELAAGGGRVHAGVCDVANPASVADAVDRASAALGGIGVIVNNAGVVEPISTVTGTDPSAWAEHMAVNLVGAFNVLHFGVPLLGAGGVVVNVSSGASSEPIAGRSAYCAGKAGLNMLGQVLALEEASRGIRVHNFTPGPTDTDMHVRIREAPINRSAGFVPARLLPVEHAARFLVWLTSEAAADLAGKFVSARDPALLARAGML